MTCIFNNLEPENNAEGSNCLERSIAVYPNPTTALLTIDLRSPCENPIRLAIYNALGQIISEHLISEPFYTVDIGGQEAGIYHAVFRTEKNMVTRKIIKR